MSLSGIMTGRDISAPTENRASMTSSPPREQNNYDSFDWMRQWYPMAWVRDLPAGRPHRLELFDEAYAVVIPSETAVREHAATPLAVQDICPHRRAALSEGRCTKQGFIQCAYHGWAFDSEGICRGIPHIKGGGKSVVLEHSTVESYPVMVSQDMVWMCPTSWSTLISSNTSVPPIPPRVPEMDDPARSYTGVVRDLPLDWTLLVGNILDPDHGMFAHQMKSMDLYSASLKAKQTVNTFQEEDSGRFVLRSEVDATFKLSEQAEEHKKSSSRAPSAVLRACSEFKPPSSIVSARRDKDGTAKFILCFWVRPTGVGRAQFMSAAVYKKSFLKLPRWLVHLGLNNFLDQDTHLLATAQSPILQAELNAFKTGMNFTRRKFYKYVSPSEKFLSAVDKFMDATVSRMPRRYSSPELFSKDTPPREYTLDRMAQHTEVCPDSMTVYKRAKFVRNCAFAASALVLMLGRKSSGYLALASPAFVVPLAISMVAQSLQHKFTYQKTRAAHEADVMNIPKLYPDESYASLSH